MIIFTINLLSIICSTHLFIYEMSESGEYFQENQADIFKLLVIKYIHFTIISNSKKQKVLTFEKLEIANVWHFCLFRDLTDYKTVVNSFPVVQLIDKLTNSFSAKL